MRVLTHRIRTVEFATLILFIRCPFGTLFVRLQRARGDARGLYLLAFSLWSLQICYASRLPFGSLRSALTRKFCQQVAIGGQEIKARKELVYTAIYTIIRVY